MNDSPRHQTRGQVLRFLLVGGLNTVLTAAIFLGLASVVASTLAYTVAFLVGVGFAVLVTPRLVFRARASTTQRMRYVAWYVMVYLLGLAIVYVLRDRWLFGTTVVAAVTFVVTAGLSFIGARFLFDRAPASGGGATISRAEP